MDTFLRSIQPEVNDLFVLSLVLINLLAWMDLFITQVTSCFLFKTLKLKQPGLLIGPISPQNPISNQCVGPLLYRLVL